MCTVFVWDERQVLGTLTQRHRVEKVSNMLLVCADGGVSAERNSVMHSYSGDFCTCRVSPYFPPGFSSLRGKRCLQERPQPVCQPGEAQTRKKSSITL